MKRSSLESGQVLLVAVLLITVILTITLSLVTRSIINMRLSTETDQSQRAISAAEAGIEKAIIGNSSVTGGLSNNSSYQATKIDLAGNSFLLNNGRIITQGQGADLWLSDYSPIQNDIYTNLRNGNLIIYWGTATESDDCRNAALEIIVLSGSKNTPIATHYNYDPCSVRRINNSFSAVTIFGPFTLNDKDYKYSTGSITINNGLIARIIPLYTNEYIGVEYTSTSGPSGLPSQGIIIESIGINGDVQRKVSVLQENPSLPIELFSYTVLSPR